MTKQGVYSGVVDIARNGVDEVIRLKALNSELVEALRALASADFGNGEWGEDAEQAALMARAVLAKVEQSK